VDLSRELRAQLWLWRRRHGAESLKNGRSRPKLVFPSVLGTPLDYSNVNKEFVAIVKKADMRHRTPHSMRHSFISLLLQKGASLAYVQKQAGHKSMDITLNTYGHFVPGGNRSAGVDLLDERQARRSA
jgi:integrase